MKKQKLNCQIFHKSFFFLLSHSLVRILELLRDKVENIPAAKRVQPGERGQAQAVGIVVALPHILKVAQVLAVKEIVQPHEHNGDEGQHLGRRKDVLHLERPARREAVDGGEKEQSTRGQHADSVQGRFALWEEGLDRVIGERDGTDGEDGGSDEDEGDPETEKGQALAKGDQQVGVVATGTGDHGAQFAVAEGAQRGHGPAQRPYNQRDGHGSGGERREDGE